MENRKLAANLTSNLIALFFACSVHAEPMPKPDVTDAGEFEKILFVGNSFSYFNNGIHNHVANLVRANGQWQAKKNRFRLLTLSGGKFSEQSNIVPNFLSTSKDNWDIVVLQDYSTGPIGKNSKKEFVSAAQHLADISKLYRARPVMFMTWAYKGKPEMAN